MLNTVNTLSSDKFQLYPNYHRQLLIYHTLATLVFINIYKLSPHGIPSFIRPKYVFFVQRFLRSLSREAKPLVVMTGKNILLKHTSLGTYVPVVADGTMGRMGKYEGLPKGWVFGGGFNRFQHVSTWYLSQWTPSSWFQGTLLIHVDPGSRISYIGFFLGKDQKLHYPTPCMWLRHFCPALKWPKQGYVALIFFLLWHAAWNGSNRFLMF